MRTTVEAMQGQVTSFFVSTSRSINSPPDGHLCAGVLESSPRYACSHGSERKIQVNFSPYLFSSLRNIPLQDENALIVCAPEIRHHRCRELSEPSLDWQGQDFRLPSITIGGPAIWIGGVTE